MSFLVVVVPYAGETQCHEAASEQEAHELARDVEGGKVYICTVIEHFEVEEEPEDVGVRPGIDYPGSFGGNGRRAA